MTEVPPATRTFYLVRHGQTDWNAQFRWQGHTDIPLNDTGREQARLLAAALSHIPFDRAVSSDSIRAVETVRIVLGDRSLEIETDPDLREFNAGAFEGLTWDEIRAQYPDAVTAMNTDWFGFVFPGGESRGQMAERAAGAVRRLLDDGRGTHILIGLHGMSLRGILYHHFPQIVAHPMDLQWIENTAVTIFRQTGAALEMVQLANAAHLQAAAD